MQYKLDKEEKEILENYENDTLRRSGDSKAEIQKARKVASNTLAKAGPISIRLSEKDLHTLKTKAIETGIPYQTLIGALVHQYAEGRIKIEL